MKGVEGEGMQLGDRPEVWEVLLCVHWGKSMVFHLDHEVSGVMQNAGAICLD